MKLTAHFDESELAQRKWFGGPSLPYPRYWIEGRAVPLLQEMEIIRAVWNRPVNVISAYRSTAFNTAIKGKPRSQHMEGRAIDFKVLGVPAALVHAKVMELIATRKLTLIRGVGRYPTFVHVDIRPSERLITWDETRRSNIPKK